MGRLAMSETPPHNPTTAEVHTFRDAVCCGNEDAKVFCDLWYKYCHLIDDILDTREDGRPTMSAEKILESYIIAAVLYNCPFFVQHRAHLFPTVLTVTNQYCDSVAWERSPLKHRRLIADVLRCCGDEMFFMIAMICGGWKHARDVSAKIRERDFLLQHDADGNPI